MLKSLFGIVIILAASRLILAAVCILQRCFHPPPEISRKLLHIGIGLLILTYPSLFSDTWPVVLLSATYIALLVAGALYQPLYYRVADVIYAVDRPSLGEFYFSLSVAILFILARGDGLLFRVPLLMLTLADAAAAVVGSHYGRYRFAIGGATKSLEGSMAFLVTAFLIVYIALTLDARLTPRTALTIAMAIAWAGTILEAVARRGVDNLLVPLGSFVAMRLMMA